MVVGGFAPVRYVRRRHIVTMWTIAKTMFRSRALVTGVPLMLVAGTLVCGVVGVRELMVGVMASGILLLALASFLLVTAVVVAARP